VVGLLELLLLLLLVLELTVVLIDGVREFSMGCLPGGGHRSSISYINQCPLLYNIFSIIQDDQYCGFR
jgi:hypothetical protein